MKALQNVLPKYLRLIWKEANKVSDVIIAGLFMAGLVGLTMGLLFVMGLDKWQSKVLSFVICSCETLWSIYNKLNGEVQS